MDTTTQISTLKELVQAFCNERDWDQFHNAKELSIGIITEASELLDIFRFKTDIQVEAILKNEGKRQEVCEEISDVFFFILRFAQRYNIDLTSELEKKIERNNLKYLVEKVKGSNKKYTEHD